MARMSGILAAPTPRQAAIIMVFASVLGWGAPFAFFRVLPRLFDADSAAQTTQNVLANQGLLGAAIFCLLLAFLGDVVLAWAGYYLLRPTGPAIVLLVSALRVVYAAMALVAVFNLATAHRLVA